MTTGPEAGATALATTRASALVLAGLHLRLGSLALARAELETLEGRGGLDPAGRVDLAEARWRTGDLVGAGEAARTALAAGEEAVVALVVAAEAASAIGRPSEARRLANQALALVGGPIDPVFAGMPRSGVWPSDPHEPAPSPATLFPPDRIPSVTSAAEAGVDEAPSPLDDEADAALAVERAAIERHAAAMAALAVEPGLWGSALDADGVPPEPGPEPEPEPARSTEPVSPAADAVRVLDGGVDRLAAGDLAGAAVRLGLVVRLAPALAPDVIAILEDTDDPGLLMVRGDALRAVGRDEEADATFAAALARATDEASPPSDTGWGGS